MKTWFYYLFGITTTLYVFVLLLNAYAFELLSDYYINIIKQHGDILFYVSMIITAIQIIFCVTVTNNFFCKLTKEDENEELTKNENQYE